MAEDPRTKAAAWMQEKVPPGAAVAAEAFPPFFATTRDRSADKIYETDWTSRSKTRRAELLQFVAEQDSIYYISDDFTRQIFTWKYTKAKYPDITRDRLDFFVWLKKNAQWVKTFQSAAPKAQPTIVVYKLFEKDLHAVDAVPADQNQVYQSSAACGLFQ